MKFSKYWHCFNSFFSLSSRAPLLISWLSFTNNNNNKTNTWGWCLPMSVSSWWISRPTSWRGVSILAISWGITCNQVSIWIVLIPSTKASYIINLSKMAISNWSRHSLRSQTMALFRKTFSHQQYQKFWTEFLRRACKPRVLEMGVTSSSASLFARQPARHPISPLSSEGS